MAITYPRELPNLDDIAQITTRHKSTVGVVEFIFSGIQKTAKSPNQKFEIEYTIIPLNRADMDEWWAWVISLNGREKTFYGVLQAPNEIKGSAKNYANPLLSGTHAARVSSISITTGPASITNYLRTGDFIQIGSTDDARLFMVLENVDTDSAGEATFRIWPDLYRGQPDGAEVVVTNPKGVFRLLENSHEILQDASNTRKGLRFSASGVV